MQHADLGHTRTFQHSGWWDCSCTRTALLHPYCPVSHVTPQRLVSSCCLGAPYCLDALHCLNDRTAFGAPYCLWCTHTASMHPYCCCVRMYCQVTWSDAGEHPEHELLWEGDPQGSCPTVFVNHEAHWGECRRGPDGLACNCHLWVRHDCLLLLACLHAAAAAAGCLAS